MIIFSTMFLCLSSACGSMNSAEQSSGIGAVAGSSAGSKATPEKGPGSLGSFLYHQQHESQVTTSPTTKQ